MRSLIIALVTLGSVAAAAPAAAQYYPNDRDGYGYGNDRGYNRESLQQLASRIDRGIRNGSISQREGYGLRRELNQLYALDRRLRRDGLTRWERNELDRRTDALSRRVRWERNDGGWRDNGRYDRDDWRGRDRDDRQYRDRRDGYDDDDD